MAWRNDLYIRDLLDKRERWGTVLSLTGVAVTFVFLAEHPYRAWVGAGPLLVGVLGSLYVLVVDCYYEQAEEIANAATDAACEEAKSKRVIRFASRIGMLGWLNILVPAIAGGLASLTLWFGLRPNCC